MMYIVVSVIVNPCDECIVIAYPNLHGELIAFIASLTTDKSTKTISFNTSSCC